MVGFISHDDEQEINSSKLKNSVDPAWCDKFDLLDLFVPEIDDVSLSVNGSFLDFDSIKDWIEEMQEPEVEKSSDTVLLEGPTVESSGLLKTEQPDVITDSGNEVVGVEIGKDAEKLLSLNSVVDEGFGKVSLVDQSDLNRADESGTKDNDLVPEGLKDVSASESESESSSADPSSSSSSSSSEDDDDDAVMEEGQKTRVIKEEGVCEVKDDLEEGEIMQTGAERMDDEFDEDEADEEDEDEYHQTGGLSGPIKSKNELNVLPPVLPVDVTLEPSHQMLPVGLVSSVVGAQVIVEGGEKHNPLSEGSILWISERRSPLGRVDEIFGPVKTPYYIVRFNSESEVPEGIHEGSLVSFVPEFVDHVLNNQNLYQKGYDASGENDEEVDEAEFSDDEKEAEYRKMLKMSKRGSNMMKNKKSNKSFKRNDIHSLNNRQVESPARPPPDYSNRPGSSRFSPAFPGGPRANPSFPHQGHQPSGFIPNSVQPNGMPFQMQNRGVANTFQMPWIQNQNVQQFPMMNTRPPFQQPFNPAGPNPNSMRPPNMNMGPTFSPLPAGNMVSNAFNQVQLPMALQAQLAQLSMLSGMLFARQGVPGSNNMQQFNQGPPNADVPPPQFNQGPPNADMLPPQLNQGAVATHHGGRPQTGDGLAPQFNQGSAAHHGGRPQNSDGVAPRFNQGAATNHGGRPQNSDGVAPQSDQGATSQHGGRSFQRGGGRGGRSRGGGRGRRGGQSFQSR